MPDFKTMFYWYWILVYLFTSSSFRTSISNVKANIDNISNKRDETKKVVSNSFIGTTRQIVLEDGSEYNLNWNSNKLSITPVKKENIIAGEDGKLPTSGYIMDEIDKIIKNSCLNDNVTEFITENIINPIIDSTFNGNRITQVSRNDFDLLINKLRNKLNPDSKDSFISNNIEDLAEFQETNESDFRNKIQEDIINKLNELQNSCFI